MQRLRTFKSFDIDSNILYALLKLPQAKETHIFALGPEGTNISQASLRWSETHGLNHKTKIILCQTPQESVERALSVKNNDIFPIITLCAVYNKLHELFFHYNNCYFFMDSYKMPLDYMQLASFEELDGEIPRNWIIATHPSPSTLLSGLTNKIVYANSNSHAAELCVTGEVNACITTEQARKKYGLKKLFIFGSPIMLFTFGTTTHGLALLKDLISDTIERLKLFNISIPIEIARCSMPC